MLELKVHSESERTKDVNFSISGLQTVDYCNLEKMSGTPGIIGGHRKDRVRITEAAAQNRMPCAVPGQLFQDTRSSLLARVWHMLCYITKVRSGW